MTRLALCVLTWCFWNGCEELSFLTFWLPDGQKETVPIERHFTTLFFVVFMSRYNDMMGDQPDALGWRHQRELAEEVGKITRYGLQQSSVTSNVSSLNRLLAGMERKLFESRKKRGIRIAEGFEITLILGRTQTGD